MKSNNSKRLPTTFLLLMLLPCGKSFGQTTCSNVALSVQGPQHFGASGGSLPITITAGLLSHPAPAYWDTCSWSTSYPTFVHPQPTACPFVFGGPGQCNGSPGLCDQGVSGQCNQTADTITVDQNLDLAPRNGNLVLTGEDNSQNPQVIPISQDAASGDFSLIAGSCFPTITKGNCASCNVFIGRTGGFIGTVCLSVSQLPAGATAQIIPQCTNGNSAVLTICTSSATPAATFTAIIAGVNGTASRFTSAAVTVDDFSLSISPPTIVVTQGSSASAQVTINPINGFSGSVGLGPSNVPSGVGFNFNPNPATGSSNMTVNANGFGTLGTFQVPITGFNANQPRTTNLTLTIAGFTLSASPTTSTVPPGAITSYQVTVNPAGGYSGSVNLAVSGLPSGASAVFTPNPTSGSSTMKITNMGATAGTYVVTITGTDGNGVSKSTNVTLLVGPLALASRYVPLAPCRIADTRGPTGPFGGPFLAGGTTREFDLPNTCGIPSTALAYALNTTVVPRGPLGYLTMLPCGQTQPATSNLNSIDGRVKAVAAIVPAGTNGGVCAFASNDTDLVLDINGYFVPATDPTGLAFYPVTPCRLVDTRLATGTLGGPYLIGSATRTFPILSSSCNVPATAQAYSLNYTTVPHGPLGYLTTWPAGQPQPLVSTLNADTGAVTANAAIVTAGSNGDVAVFVTNDTDLIIDVNGYFAPPGPGALSLFPLTPCRLLDTRNPAGSTSELNPEGPTATSPFSGTLTVNVAASGCGAPASAQAYVLNATVIPPATLGYITLWPNGTPQPLVSTLNAIDGAVTSNLALVPTANGSVNVFVSNPTQLVLDVFGYFAP
jgi:hypothetical protein